MALTFGTPKPLTFGAKGGWRMGFVDITFDNSYPSGGEAVVASDLGLTGLYALMPPPAVITSATGYVIGWDHVNGKLTAFDCAADGDPLDELGNTSAVLSTLVIRCMYIGW